MAADIPVCDRVLSILLTAMEGGGLPVLPTHEVARRAGVPMSSLIGALPVLLERAHLDPRTHSGTLRLSQSGIGAARARAGGKS